VNDPLGPYAEKRKFLRLKGMVIESNEKCGYVCESWDEGIELLNDIKYKSLYIDIKLMYVKVGIVSNEGIELLNDIKYKSLYIDIKLGSYAEKRKFLRLKGMVIESNEKCGYVCGDCVKSSLRELN
jgi:hypothetical protein